MIQARKNPDGTITIHTDHETAEYIWAITEIASREGEGNGERTRAKAKEIANAVDTAI